MVQGTWLRAGALALAGVSGAMLLAACGMQAQANTGPRSPEKIYQTTCGYCHGRNVGPIIKGRELPPESVTYMVRNGIGGMPAFRPTEITNEELDALAVWISESKADPAEHGQ